MAVNDRGAILELHADRGLVASQSQGVATRSLGTRGRGRAFWRRRDPEEPDMANDELKRKRLTPAWSPAAPEEESAPAREKPSDLKDASDMLRLQAEVAKRAADYADANAGDFEEE
jgi:hypothetical protein